jgi:hypothetical protein
MKTTLQGLKDLQGCPKLLELFHLDQNHCNEFEGVMV